MDSLGQNLQSFFFVYVTKPLRAYQNTIQPFQTMYINITQLHDPVLIPLKLLKSEV